MKFLITFTFLLFSFTSLASVQVKNINLTKLGSIATLKISFKGKLQSDPELFVRDNIVQVALKDIVVWPKIEKRIGLSAQKARKDTTLLAYQYDKKLARVRALLPYTLKNDKHVDMRIKNNMVFVTFPIKNVKAAAPVVKVSKNKKGSKAYDESFLDRLLNEKEQAAASPKLEKKNQNKRVLKKNRPAVVQQKVVVEDKVKSTLSGLEKSLTDVKDDKGSFNVISYFGKFVVFLGVILLLFYSVVYLMRKGVLKKGKLGFLNETNVITVLNTTYVGPKKSLLLVKVHNQTFLLSSTEKGMEFLSEVKDTPGLLKQGEHDIAGNNFDSALTNENDLSPNIVLKENISESKPLVEERGILASLKKSKSREQVRFSDQIKSKVKNLKPLQ